MTREHHGCSVVLSGRQLMVTVGEFIEVTRMDRFYMRQPLYMQRIATDEAGQNFKVVAGGYGYTVDIRCRRGFQLNLRETLSATIDWHVADPDVAWAAAVAEQLLGDD